jgi:hypothetical protein
VPSLAGTLQEPGEQEARDHRPGEERTRCAATDVLGVADQRVQVFLTQLLADRLELLGGHRDIAARLRLALALQLIGGAAKRVGDRIDLAGRRILLLVQHRAALFLRTPRKVLGMMLGLVEHAGVSGTGAAGHPASGGSRRARSGGARHGGAVRAGRAGAGRTCRHSARARPLLRSAARVGPRTARSCRLARRGVHPILFLICHRKHSRD